VPKAGLPDDIAQAALYLASDDSAFVTGTHIVVDGGITVGGRQRLGQEHALADPGGHGHHARAGRGDAGPAGLRRRGGLTLTPNLRGALWMLASAVGFTAMTTLIKFLGPGYPAALQTFYRQLAGVLVLLPLMARDWRGFATTRPGILIFRSSAGVLGMILGFYAYQKMPLADANALSFTRTLWLVPLAAFVLREPVGPLRLGAALVGFLGVLIMLRPGAGGAAPGSACRSLALLASAFLFALTITGMKVMTRDHSPVRCCWSAASLGLVLAIPGACSSGAGRPCRTSACWPPWA
jgi:drug/metabolite transporter (DMT)-like permease